MSYFQKTGHQCKKKHRPYEERNVRKNANIHFILFMLPNDWMLLYELLAALFRMPRTYPGNGYMLIYQANIA